MWCFTQARVKLWRLRPAQVVCTNLWSVIWVTGTFQNVLKCHLTLNNKIWLVRWLNLQAKFCTCLTHWSLVMPYGDIELGQHWFRKWRLLSPYRHGVPFHWPLDCLCNILLRWMNSKEIITALHNCSFMLIIHQAEVDSPHKGPVKQKAFPWHGIIMHEYASEEDRNIWKCLSIPL